MAKREPRSASLAFFASSVDWAFLARSAGPSAGHVFFPLGLAIFSPFVHPKQGAKKASFFPFTIFHSGKPFGIPTFIRSIRWLGKASYGHPRSVKVPVVPPSHHHKGTIGMSSSHHLCTAWLEKIQIFDGKWYRIFRHTWAMLAICELGGTYLILLK